MKLLLLAIFGLCVLSSVPATGKRVVCYFSSWAVYRQGEGKFLVEDIDPNVCTHLVYAFVSLANDGTLTLNDAWNDVGDDWHEGNFFKFQDLKKVNPNLKTMLAVGGWNHGPGPFQAVVKNQASRAKFIQTSVDMLTQYGFDGLDIDWEYQDAVGGTAEDRTGFSTLLREMSASFHQRGLLLSAATSANFNLIENCYELDVMSETVDFINIMAYDLHGSWEKFTGHVAPLHKLGSESGDAAHLNVEAVVNKYIERGAKPEKINLGLVAYGRTFTLTDASQHDLGSPASGPGNMGSVTPEQGSMAYLDVCLKLKAGTLTEVWNDEQKIPYGYENNQWMGYDNARSIAEKLQFAKSKGIGGAMLWSVETDDHKNLCQTGTFPIINAINSNIWD